MKPLDVLLAEIEETEDEVMYQKLKDMAMKIISSSTKKRGKIDLIKSGKDGAVIPNEVGKINAAKPKVGAETLGTDETQEGNFVEMKREKRERAGRF